MIHCTTRQFDDPHTSRRKTRVFLFEADTQEEYQAIMEEIARMPLPGVPTETGGEGDQ